MAIPYFCSNCGAQLNATAKFCASCGKPTRKETDPAPAPHEPAPRAAVTAAAAPVPASSAPQECALAVLPGAVRRSGLMGLKHEMFVIVFTDRRVVFAAQTSEMMKANIQRARDAAKVEGKGFFGQWGAQFGANSGSEYLQIPPQQILAEQPANFYLNNDQMRRIRLNEQHDDESAISTYTLEFETLGGKFKFHFNNMDIRGWKKQLQQYYGSIVR